VSSTLEEGVVNGPREFAHRSRGFIDASQTGRRSVATARLDQLRRVPGNQMRCQTQGEAMAFCDPYSSSAYGWTTA